MSAMNFVLHPLLRLSTTQPQLLADHAEAYSELIGEQFSAAMVNWRWRTGLNAAAVGLAAIAMALAGVATMFWAITPIEQIHQPLVLIAIPLTPAALAIGCWSFARRLCKRTFFADVRRQLKVDLALLRQVSPS